MKTELIAFNAGQNDLTKKEPKLLYFLSTKTISFLALDDVDDVHR